LCRPGRPCFGTARHSPSPPASRDRRTTPIEPERDQVTRVLDALGRGEGHASRDLLPLVYDELRRLAARRLAHERPGQTLQATALVHEAYLRLVGGDPGRPWHGRAHFFAAAAEAMRRILVDRARGKASLKAGGALRRLDLDDFPADVEGRPDLSLALDEALTELERHDETAARLVKLRYFAGMNHQQAADALGIGRRAADRLWTLARAWLFQRLGEP
jgi:RNA polymerase sigma factor (TIGR02999 family)